jgi:hypothetical protein
MALKAVPSCAAGLDLSTAILPPVLPPSMRCGYGAVSREGRGRICCCVTVSLLSAPADPVCGPGRHGCRGPCGQGAAKKEAQLISEARLSSSSDQRSAHVVYDPRHSTSSKRIPPVILGPLFVPPFCTPCACNYVAIFYAIPMQLAHAITCN